eukprot:scaffold23402_cov32-Tisochrysis_lutea.AAC.2
MSRSRSQTQIVSHSSANSVCWTPGCADVRVRTADQRRFLGSSAGRVHEQRSDCGAAAFEGAIATSDGS